MQQGGLFNLTCLPGSAISGQIDVFMSLCRIRAD
jgi:hypothetical protein